MFVNLDPQAAPLSEFLGGLVQRVAPLNLASCCISSSGEPTRWDATGRCSSTTISTADTTCRICTRGSTAYWNISSTPSRTRTGIACSRVRWSASEVDAATSATRQGDRAWYFWQYPNFMINLYAGYMDTNLVLPDGVDRCKVIFDFYFDDVSEAAAERNRQSIAVGERVNDEDVGICESVQRGLHSRAYGAGRLVGAA